MNKQKILLVDDERDILELIGFNLEKEGYEVYTAENGRKAIEVANRVIPDLILLDVMMPGLDGFEVVRRLRNEGSTAPVLFLTARDSTEDKVRGLTVGGDDYVTKPFSLEEVIARIRALLRRAGTLTPAPSTMLSVGDIDMDEDRHEVLKAGEPVNLSPTEYNLLRLFMRNPDRVLSKAVILDQVWDYDFGGDASIVESYVSYLRRKVDTSEPRMIQTVRGVGYSLRPPRG